MTAATPALENAKSGCRIWGYVSRSSNVPAPNEIVTLIDGRSDKPTGRFSTDPSGKYNFDGLKPGIYRVKVAQLETEVEVKNENRRVDVDLNNATREMNDTTESVSGVEQTDETPARIGKTPVQATKVSNRPMDDLTLAQQISGHYWGHIDSTESEIGLCPNGRYYDYAESTYSGQFSDEQGNQTGSWGTASQRVGAGRWTIKGTKQKGTIQVVDQGGREFSIQYRAGGEIGCFYFDDRHLCRTGTCQ